MGHGITNTNKRGVGIGYHYDPYKSTIPKYTSPPEEYEPPNSVLIAKGANVMLNAGKSYMDRTPSTPSAPVSSPTPVPKKGPNSVSGSNLFGAGMMGMGAGNMAQNVNKSRGLSKRQQTVAGMWSAVGSGASVGGPWGALAGGVAYGITRYQDDPIKNERDVADFMTGGMPTIVQEGTWLCTATRDEVGLSEGESEALNQLRSYSRKTHKKLFMFYIRQGKKLVEKIKDSECDLNNYYKEFKQTLVKPVTALVEIGRLGSAFRLYETVTKKLFNKYMPELEVPNG